MPSELMMALAFIVLMNSHPSTIIHFGRSSAPKWELHSLNGRFALSQEETLAPTGGVLNISLTLGMSAILSNAQVYITGCKDVWICIVDADKHSTAWNHEGSR